MGNSKVKVLSLLDTFNIDGKWFLPGQDIDSDGIYGTVVYDLKSISLRMQGAFDESVTVGPDRKNNIITILGISNMGERFTLLGCSVDHMQYSYPGYPTSSFYVSKCYVGDYFIENENDIEDLEVELSYLNMDAWMQYPVINSSYSEDGKCTLEIDLLSPDSDRAKYIVHDSELSLSEEVKYKIANPKDYLQDEAIGVSINRFYRICPMDEQKISITKVFEFMQQYRRLLVMLIGVPVYFSYIDYSIPGEAYKNGTKETKTRKHVRFFFSQVGDPLKTKRINPSDPFSMLLRRSEIKADLGGIINKWVSNTEKYNNSCASYISDLYLPSYIETTFLNVAKGLEAFHRFFAEKEQDKKDQVLESERNRIIDFIKNNVSKDNLDYFISRVNYQDDITFGRRVKELIKQLPEELRNRLFGPLNSKERNKLVTQIVQTRNYWTHRDRVDEYPEAIISPMELMDTIHKLRVVLQYYILISLGIDDKLIERRLIEKCLR